MRRTPQRVIRSKRAIPKGLALSHASITRSNEPVGSEGSTSQETVQAEPSPEAASGGQSSPAAQPALAADRQGAERESGNAVMCFRLK